MSLSRKKDVWPSVPALFGNVWAGDPLRAMEELLGRDAQVARHARAPHAFMPSVEVKENSEGYVVKADLPGIKLDDVKVTLTGNVLRIEGHRAEFFYFAEERSRESQGLWFDVRRLSGEPQSLRLVLTSTSACPITTAGGNLRLR